MKRVLLVLLGLLVSVLLSAQSTQRVPDYFGFYLLKIPDFTWVEGATVQGEFKRYTGVLNLDNARAPMFISQDRDPVPLSLNQASALALALAAGSKKPFDLVGVEGKSQDPSETASSFFVPFYAEVGDQRVNLIPTMTEPNMPSGSGSKSGPSVGPGGIGGKYRY